jgi:glycosyltransferase involved in cell wall biosynthesis
MSNFIDQITVLILTYNEAPNIGRTLHALRSFTDIVVLDSCSSDETLALVASHPHARVVQRPFDNLGAQWNYGLQQCGIRRPWVLALDADYLVPQALVEEIAALAPREADAGYLGAFRYAVHGRILRGTLYPPVTVLYRRERAHYVQEGHAQRVRVQGQLARLHERLVHDDRKPLARWLSSQASYCTQEADHLLGSRWSELNLQDKLRRLVVIAPWLVPLYCLTVGRGMLDGRAGLYYALQRGVAESLLAVRLLERRLGIKQ